MKILITLCARGGSKGIPQKNIKLLNGIPLIEYSFRIAQNIVSIYNDSIIELSTDDEDILSTAKKIGLTTNYRRPEYLATDSAGKVDAIKDLLKFSESEYQTKFDFILDLDVSSPLRTTKDILEAFSIIKQNSDALTLFSVNKANKNPYFNMVEKSDDGFYQLSKRSATTTLSRQTAPNVYELNASFYIYNRKYFDLNLNGVITNKSLIYNMNHICFDLDHLIDFEFMEFLMANNKLEFNIE